MTFVPITCFTAVHFLLYAQLRGPLIAILSVSRQLQWSLLPKTRKNAVELLVLV